jgi:hypothetical protein
VPQLHTGARADSAGSTAGPATDAEGGDVTVYKGVLEKMSGGDTIANQGRSRVVWGGYWQEGARDVQYGWRQRQFVEIGGRHIRNLVLTPYHDEVLADAIGHEVKIGAHGSLRRGSRTPVVGVRTPKIGLDKPSIVILAVGTVVGLIKMVLALAALAVGTVLAIMIVGRIFDSFPIGLVAGSPFMLCALVILLGTCTALVKTWVTWFALW